MKMFASLISKIRGKETTAFEILESKIAGAFEGHLQSDSAKLIQDTLMERLTAYTTGRNIDWSRSSMSQTWEVDATARSEHVTHLMRALLAIMPEDPFNQKRFVHDLNTLAGLGSKLQSDIWFAINKIVKRKTALQDVVASEIVTYMWLHHENKNHILLNGVLQSVSSEQYPKTFSALRKLYGELGDKLSLSDFDKSAAAKIGQLIKKSLPKSTDKELPPRLKWVTLNSLTRAKAQIENDGGGIISDDYLAIVEDWKRRLFQESLELHERRRTMVWQEIEALKKSGGSLPSDLKDEAFDLQGWIGPPVENWRKEKLNRLLGELTQLIACMHQVGEHHRSAWLFWRNESKAITGKSSPSKTWLRTIAEAPFDGDRDRQLKFLHAVLAQIDWPPRLQGNNLETLRAAIFGSVNLTSESLCETLATFAEKYCFATIPKVGISCEKLGNACLWALINRPNAEGIPHLSRLHLKIKYPKVKAKIAAALDEAAKSAGISRGALEETSFRDFALDRERRKTIPVGVGEAILAIDDLGKVSVGWRIGQGRLMNAPPSQLKSESNAILKVRALVKEIEAELSAHRVRLQKIWLENRTWNFTEWQKTYGDHPVVGSLACRLIWIATKGGQETAFIYKDGFAQDIAGKPLDPSGSVVSLWHPVLRSVKDVLAWRQRIVKLGIVQPFKQAHREIYVATPAEHATGTYSNRFAGHVLKQHQLILLARLNGWSITHRISADVKNDAPTHLVISAHGMVAEYWTEAAGGHDAEFNDAGAYLYLTTDQLRFYKIADQNAPVKRIAYGPERGAVIPIHEVPVIVLSEVMRHCDLFVGVTSIANDPNWLDKGGNAEHPNQWHRTVGADYWGRQSFGELDLSAATRMELLLELLPALEIGAVSRIEGRFLKVKGKLRTYKIHLGSANILMEPNDTYLCIVPKRDTSVEKLLTLPFEGDQRLSLIISKAMLLANDDKITDAQIRRQLDVK
jgi:hypothetical protein